MIALLLRFALRQRFVTLLIGLSLIGMGIWAFQQLKIEAYPDISDTQVVVVTRAHDSKVTGYPIHKEYIRIRTVIPLIPWMVVPGL